jgi:hypothetical protein
MVNHKEYYKGEGGHGFSQVRAMVNFVSLCMLVAHLCMFMVCPCTKNAPTMH